MRGGGVPMKDLRKSLKVEWYRCPIDPGLLRKLTRRSNLKGMLQAIGPLAVLAGTGLLTYYLFNQRNWIGFALSLFVHGTFYGFLGAGRHELSHGTVFRTKWLNSFFVRVYSIMSWDNFRHYKMSHMYHHLFTLHRVGDGEVVLPSNPTLRALSVLQMFTFNFERFFKFLKSTSRETFLGSYDGEWSKAIYADQSAELKKSINWVRTMVVFHLGVVAVSLIFRLWMLPVLTTLSPFIGNWWRHLVVLTQHGGLRDNVPDFRKCTRSVNLDPLTALMYWRMNYHTEHHMYGAVPSHNLRKLSKAIASDMPVRKTVFGAWREMRTTWKKQRIDPNFQHDTPVPSAGVAGMEANELAASIGEIEPSAFAG